MGWTYENGAAGVVAGITNWKGAWLTSTLYKIGDGVQNDGSGYVCILEHTSGATTEPGTGVDWATYWSLLASKGDAGTGLANVVDDTTPQLGGDLDMNGHNIGGNSEAELDDAVSKKHSHSNAADLANVSGTNTGDQTLSGLGGIAHSLATAVNDFLVASGAGVFVKKTLAEVKTILGLGSAAYTPSTDYAAASHNHSANAITSDTLDGDRLPALSTAKKGGVPATGTPSGKYLKDDGTWATPPGGGGTGDVVGPATNTDAYIPQWNGADSKTLKNGLAVPAGGLAGLTALGDKEDKVSGKGLSTNDYTTAEQSKLSGIETAADVTDAGNVGSSIHGSSAKTTMVDADKIAIIDTEASNVLKTLSWAYVKSILKTYFDSLYNLYVHPNHSGDVTSVADGAQTITTKAVTLAKMDDLAQNTIIGRVTASTGVPEALSATNVRTIINVADGATANAKATASEINTGTDNDKFATPDALAGSNLGMAKIQIKICDDATALTTGDGKLILMIPAELNGMNLVKAHAGVTTVSSSGAPLIQIRNVTDSADMLSTRITIDANETTSYTAATAPVIDTSHDDVATGDLIAIDVDGAGTGAKGLIIYLAFQTP